MRNKLIFILTFLMATVALFAVYLFIMDNRTWSDIEKEHKIKVISSCSVMSYYIDNGQPAGFSYELLRQIADSLHLSLDVTVEENPDLRVKRFQSGKYDLMLDLVPVTSDTRKLFIFSTPIMKTNLVLVEKSGLSADSCIVNGYSKLYSDTIYMRKPGFDRLVIDNMNSELGLNLTVMCMDGNAERLCKMVNSGEIRYLALDCISAHCIMAIYPELDLNAGLPLGFTQFLSWGITDHDFREKVDSVYSVVNGTENFMLLKNKYGIALR